MFQNITWRERKSAVPFTREMERSCRLSIGRRSNFVSGFSVMILFHNVQAKS